MRAIYIIFTLICFVFHASAQEMLTIENAVAVALENNYNIKLSRTDLQIAKENVTYGNAGMLPGVTGNFSQSNSAMNSKQTQSNGEVRALDNAKNNNMSYGVSVGWTIFDGLGMFSRYETLKELQKQGEVSVKKSIVTLVADVITTYYQIVEQQNLLSAIDSTIVISKERYRTAENRFSIGKASRLELLNVEVNLNEDVSSRLRQLDVVKNLKVTLNQLLARKLEQDFIVEKEVRVNENLVFTDLLEIGKKNNPDLMAIAISKRLAELEVKNIKANRYPTVRLNGGYNFSESESSLGFVAQSNSKGLNYGVTASVNIFDGFNQRRNERIAKLRVDQANIMIEQQNLNLESALLQAYQSYQTNIALAKMEEKNENIARQNLNITLDKFKIGTISTVEFRDAQENYLNAVSRNNTTKLQAKLSEVALQELIGQIDLVN